MKEVYAEILTHIAAYLVGIVTALLIRRSPDGQRVDVNAELCGAVSDNIGQAGESVKSAGDAVGAIQSEIGRSREEFGKIENIIRRINERNGISKDPDNNMEDCVDSADGGLIRAGSDTLSMN